MSDTTCQTTKIMLKPDAVNFMLRLPCNVKSALIDFIRSEAQHADTAMVVISWTFDDTWPHIERAMKWYATRPTIRILFHRTHEGITIDRIAYRDCDTYER